MVEASQIYVQGSLHFHSSRKGKFNSGEFKIFKKTELN